MIKAVLFDLDETLLARRESLLDFLADQWEKFNIQANKEIFIARFLALDDNGRVWKDIVYDSLVKELALPQSTAILLDDYVTNFRNFSKPFLGALEALESLKNKNFALGIISNGRHDFQMSVIDALGLTDLMSVILISESAGVRKPDPAIFERALATLDVRPEQVVFVGDNPEADIAGAHKVGMKTIWFENKLFAQPMISDGTLNDYRDLGDLVASLI